MHIFKYQNSRNEFELRQCFSSFNWRLMLSQILSNDHDDYDDCDDEKKDDGAETHRDLSLVLRDVSAT